MRSWGVACLFVLVGCATAALDDEGKPQNEADSGVAKDAGSSAQNDASNPSPTFDAGNTTTQDSGNAQVDAGNNNNGCDAFQGTLATFDFSGQPGNQTSTAATSTASGVTAGAIARAATLTATSGQDSINASAWGTGTKVDTTRYYTFTIAPTAPCTLDLNSISITTKASSTGPADVALATSDDNFASTANFSPNVTATPSLSVSSAAGSVEVRVYGYDASGTGGTLRIDTTLTVTGALH